MVIVDTRVVVQGAVASTVLGVTEVSTSVMVPGEVVRYGALLDIGKE